MTLHSGDPLLGEDADNLTLLNEIMGAGNPNPASDSNLEALLGIQQNPPAMGMQQQFGDPSQMGANSQMLQQQQFGNPGSAFHSFNQQWNAHFGIGGNVNPMQQQWQQPQQQQQAFQQQTPHQHQMGQQNMAPSNFQVKARNSEKHVNAHTHTYSHAHSHTNTCTYSHHTHSNSNEQTLKGSTVKSHTFNILFALLRPLQVTTQ